MTLCLLGLLFIGPPAEAYYPDDLTVAVSGKAYANSLGGVWTGCNGGGGTVTVNFPASLNPTHSFTTTCNATGDWSIDAQVSDIQSGPARVYISGAVEGSTFYKLLNWNWDCCITGLAVTKFVMSLEGDWTNAEINAADGAAFSDGTNLTTASTTKTAIHGNYSPGGTVTTGQLTMYSGQFSAGGMLTLTTGGTSQAFCGLYAAGGAQPLCSTNASNLLMNGYTVTFTGTTDTSVESGSFAAINFTAPNVTYNAIDNLTASGVITVGDGTNYSGLDMGVKTLTSTSTTSSLIVRSNAIVSGTNNVTVNGTVTGGGSVSITGGTFHQRVSTASKYIGSNANASDWTFTNLKFSNSDSADRTINTSATGTGKIVVTGNLTVGDASDTNTTTLDIETTSGSFADRTFDVNGNVLIESTGVISASSTKSFTIQGNYTNNGTFTSNSGTITLDGNWNETQSLAGTLSGANGKFYKLTADGVSNTLVLPAGSTTAVSNTFRLGNSATCIAPKKLRSSTPGTPATLDVMTTSTIGFVDVSDSTATSSAPGTATFTSTTSSNNGGGNTGWALSSGGCAGANTPMTIYGKAYNDEATTAWTGCSPTSRNIGLVVGSDVTSVACAADGTFSFTHALPTTNAPLVMFLNTDGGDKGATLTMYTSATDVGTVGTPLKLSKGYTRIRSETGSSIGADEFDAANTQGIDSIYDADIPYTFNAISFSAGELNVATDVELFVEAGMTFAPTSAILPAQVNATSMDIEGTYIQQQGAFAESLTDTFSGIGTSTTCAGNDATVQMPLCVGATGTFTYTTGNTTKFSGAGTDVPITSAIYGTLCACSSGTGSFQLGAGGNVGLNGGIVVGDGTNATTLDTSTYSPNVSQVAGQYNSLTVMLGSTLSGSGTGLLAFTEDVTGDGTISLTGGTFTQRIWAPHTFGPTGSNDWTFNNLTIGNRSGVSNQTLTTATPGTASTTINGTLTVGTVADSYTTTLDNETNDRILDLNGDLSITSKGTFVASSTALQTVAGSAVNDGTFTRGAGTIEFDDSSKTSTIGGAVGFTGASAFYNLRVATANKPMRFSHMVATQVTGTTGTYKGFTVDGSACTSKVDIDSDDGSNPFSLNVSGGNSTVTYASIKHSNSTTALTATGSYNGGNNTSWTISGCVSLQGTAYDDETQSTFWSGCALYDIALSVNGGPKQTTSCVGGTFWFVGSVPLSAADQVITIWMDDNAPGGDGAIFTRNLNTTSDMFGLSLVQNHVRLRSESATDMTNAAINTYDATQDPDIPIDSDGTNATVSGTTELVVVGSETYTPGGNVTTYSMQITGTYAGGGVNTLTLTGSGTSEDCSAEPGIEIPLCINGGTFTANANTAFTGTSAAIEGLTYNTLSVQPATGGTIQLGSAALQTITASSIVIGDGTATGATVSTTTNSPTVNISGSMTVNAGTTYGGSGTNATTVNGTVNGTGAISLSGGTFEQRIGSAQSFGQSGTNNNSWTFNNLTFSNSTAGALTVTGEANAGTGAVVITGTMEIGKASDGAAATTTFDDEANDHIFDVNGNFSISTKGIYSASSTAALTVAGDFTNNNTFTANNGTVTIDGSGGTTSNLAYTAATTFKNLTIATGAKTVQFKNGAASKTIIAASGTFTSTGTGCQATEAVRLQSDAGGSAFQIDTSAAGATAAITYTELKDTNSTAAITANRSVLISGNTNISTNGCVTVSGFAYSGDNTTKWSQCDGGGANTTNIGVAVNGVVRTTTCSSVDGSWSITRADVRAANDVVTAWLNPTVSGDKGATYTHATSNTASITALLVEKNYIRITSENATSITNANINTYDSTNDADIPASSDGTNLTAAGSIELQVVSGKTFAPGGNITVGSLDLRGTYTEAAGATTTMLAAGTNLTCTGNSAGTQIPLCISGGTYTVNATGTAKFTPSGTAYITTAITYYNLNLSPSANNVTISPGTDTPQTLNINGNLVLGNGTNTGGNIDFDVFRPVMNVGTGSGTGSITVNYGMTYTKTTGTQPHSITGSFAGAGDVDFSLGILDMDQYRNETLGPTGSENWVLHTLNIRNTSVATPYSVTVNHQSAPTGYDIATAGVSVGHTSGSHGTAILNLGSSWTIFAADLTINLRGNVTEGTNSLATFFANLDNSNGGSFTKSATGTVSFNDSLQTSTILGATTFNNLQLMEAGKILALPGAVTTTVAGALTLAGTSCAAPTYLRSSSGTATVAATATSINNAEINNITASPGISTNSNSYGSGTTGWDFSNNPCTYSLSGTAYEDEGTTKWGLCDGISQNIALSIDGAAKIPGSCSAVDGTYTFTSIPYLTPGPVLTVFMDGPSSDKGVVYTNSPSTPTSPLTGLNVMKDRVQLGGAAGAGASVYTNATMNSFDSSSVGGSNIPINSTGPTATTSSALIEIRVPAGSSYFPEGSVTTGSLDVPGNLNPSGGATTLITLQASGTSACSGNGAGVEMPLCWSGSGSYNNWSSLNFKFTGTGDSKLQFADQTGFVGTSISHVGKVWIAPTSGSPTITIQGNVAGLPIEMAGGLTIDGGTVTTANTAEIDISPNCTRSIDSNANEAYCNTTPTYNLTIAAGATFAPTGTVNAYGDVTGAGVINQTSGTFSKYTGAGGMINITPGNDWTFNNLKVLCGLSATSSVTLSGLAGNSITVNGNFTVGDGVGATTLDATTYADNLTVKGNTTIAATSTLKAPTNLTLNGNFTNSAGAAGFVHNNKTVTFDDNTKTSNVSYSAATTFKNLSVTSAGKTIQFGTGASNKTIIAAGGAFTAIGTGCDTSTAINLQSQSAGTAYLLDTTGATATIEFSRVKDTNSTAAITGNNSASVSGNTNVTANGCITVSGTAYDDETGTIWAGCALGYNLSASANGSAKVTTTCNAGTGAFTFTGSVPASVADASLVVFLDPAAGSDGGATYTRNLNNTSAIAGISVTKSRVRLRSETATPMFNATVDVFDYDNDTKIPVQVTTNNLVQRAPVKVVAEPSVNYVPSGTVTVSAFEILGTVNGFLNYMNLTGSGTSQTCTDEVGTAMPLCVNGGTLVPFLSTSFSGTSDLTVPAVNYPWLGLSPSGGSNPTYTLGTAAGQVITSEYILVGDGVNAVTVSTSAYSPTVSVAGGTAPFYGLEVLALATFGGTGTGAITIDGTVQGGGAIIAPNATFEHRPNDAQMFGQTSGSTDWNFSTLKFTNPTAADLTTTLAAGGTGSINVSGAFLVGSATDTNSTILDANTNDRATDINGDLDITSNGVFEASSDAALNVAGDFTNNGTFNGNTGLFTLDSTGTSTLLYAATTTFSALEIIGAGKTVQFDHLHQTNIDYGFTVDGNACETLINLDSDSAGDPYSINAIGSTSLQFIKATDSNAVTPLSSNSAESGGNNTGWALSSGGCSTISIAVTAGSAPSISPSPLLPGEDGSSQSTLNVQTNSAAGYAVTAADTSDTAGMNQAAYTIDDWTGTNAGPSEWTTSTSGSNGYFGVAVLDATGGKLTKWGTTSTLETDWAANRYIGLKTAPATLHATSSGTSTTSDDIVVAYRLTPSMTTPAGVYSTTITYTATANT